jgi:hypothetical protein
MEYSGLAAERLDWSGDTLVMRYTHPYSGPGRYASYNEAYRVNLVTPLSNVRQIRQTVTSHGSGMSMPAAILFTTVCTALVLGGVYAATAHSDDDAWVVPGIIAADVGGLGALFAIPLLGGTIWEAQHPSTDEVLYPR